MFLFNTLTEFKMYFKIVGQRRGRSWWFGIGFWRNGSS